MSSIVMNWRTHNVGRKKKSWQFHDAGVQWKRPKSTITFILKYPGIHLNFHYFESYSGMYTQYTPYLLSMSCPHNEHERVRERRWRRTKQWGQFRVLLQTIFKQVQTNSDSTVCSVFATMLVLYLFLDELCFHFSNTMSHSRQMAS